jgi:hypothetical protein
MMVAAAGEEIRPGMVAVVQTFGSTINFHPHVDAIVSRGGWTKGGGWVPLSEVDARAGELLFRHKVLSLLRKARLIDGSCCITLFTAPIQSPRGDTENAIARTRAWIAPDEGEEMTKQKKSSKSSPQPDLEIKDLKPRSDPKGGSTDAQYKPIVFKKYIDKSTP